MADSSQTPMMSQFNSVKEQYEDCLLFYRMGDFYEMFGEDAKIASKILGIALTARNKKSENPVPMCGVPYHSYKSYLTKLVGAGYKVAICDQLENPSEAKGLVKRGVTRIVSQGTVVDEDEVTAVDNNFLLAIYQSEDGIYFIAAVDVSTGEVFLTKADDDNIDEVISGFRPKEIISSFYMDRSYGIVCSVVECDKNNALKYVRSKYKANPSENFGIDNGDYFIPLAMAFTYVDAAMLNIVFARPSLISDESRLIVDQIASSTLDLLESSENKGNSLFSVLNYTGTAMGARLLKWWITHPLRNISEINTRLDNIEFFIKEWSLTNELEEILNSLYDIERISNRAASGRITPKELIWLRDSIKEFPKLADMLLGTGVDNIASLGCDLKKAESIGDLISRAIVDEPPQGIKDGDIIRSGYNGLVDEYRDIKSNGRQFLADLELKLKNQTGINQLKVSYNKVFGYYIEVSKSNLSKVPDTFERKQTLVNAERYVTDELKQLENMILNAEDKLSSIEYEIFCQVRDEVSQNADTLRKISKNIALLDCYLSLARASVTNNYCRPEISDNGVIDIKDARHPMVEVNSKEPFIANDICLNSGDSRLLIITGPNMAGKSTYIRSVAVITLMAHMGSFVPASHAKISLTDRIFTRIGASDNIARGESTFMVEMVETANILAHATSKSLIILDEIGRGTSTFDGVSIAWAVSEYILNNIKAKTFFATHYHEITSIADNKGAKNYTISVKEQNKEIIFLHKIVEGCADKSYGIYVAKLAGLPAQVISRAESVLEDLHTQSENGKVEIHKGNSEVVIKPMLIFDEHPIVGALKEIDINSLTPIDALNKLNELKKLL